MAKANTNKQTQGTPKPKDTDKHTWEQNQYDLWVKVAKPVEAAPTES